MGLPPIVGRSKKWAFSDINQIMVAFASLEREIAFPRWKRDFIEGNSLTIPMYAISCFKVPLTLCGELENLMANFWWVQKVKERKIHWVG